MAEDTGDNMSPLRVWLRSRAKMITIYAGAIAAMISVAVGWNQLDLPTPATHNDVEVVQQYAESTREIVLNQEWFRLETELRRAEAEYAKASSPALLDYISRLKASIRSVQSAITELSR